MQQAMPQQEGHFVEVTPLPFSRLPERRLEADDDVAEQPRTLPVTSHGEALGLRKGEHVGGFVLVTIIPVQRVDARVVREEDGELGRALSEASQHSFGAFAEDSERNGAGDPSRADDDGRHCCSA